MKSIHPARLLFACALATAAGGAMAQSAAPQVAAPTMSGSRTSVDDQGRRRPVEHDDRIDDSQGRSGPATLQRGSSGAAAARTLTSRSGATGIALDESFMSYTVVRRNADGSLSSTCVPGKERAERIAQQSAVPVRGGAHETE